MEKNCIASSWKFFYNSLIGAHKKIASHWLCEICSSKKNINQMFAVPNCKKRHRYCTKCIAKYIEIKLRTPSAENRENVDFVKCPGSDCKGLLQLQTCKRILPKRVVALWQDAICESMIAPSQKFYCPFNDCSAVMVNDSKHVIREAECPVCHRLFCAHCNVPWHSGLNCEVFSRLMKGRQDLMLHELAKKKQWQRCPSCKFFVEKIDGCLHMICRCGHAFCYACGATWTSTHGRTCIRRAPRLT